MLNSVNARLQTLQVQVAVASPKNFLEKNLTVLEELGCELGHVADDRACFSFLSRAVRLHVRQTLFHRDILGNPPSTCAASGKVRAALENLLPFFSLPGPPGGKWDRCGCNAMAGSWETRPFPKNVCPQEAKNPATFPRRACCGRIGSM